MLRIKGVIGMNEIINVIIGLVVIVLVGAFATFLMLLNACKDEVWKEINKILNGGDNNE